MRMRWKAMLCLCALVLGSSAAAAPDSDYRRIRRAVFLSMYRARIDLDQNALLDALGKLRPNLFSPKVRAKLAGDLEAIERLKLAWLEKHRAAAAKWAIEARAAQPPMVQSPPPPYRAALPAELAVTRDDAGYIDPDEAQSEIDRIRGKLGSGDARSLLLADVIYDQLAPTIGVKSSKVNDQFAKHPDLGFQVLRWAVFQVIGKIGGDRSALGMVLDQLVGISPAVTANTKQKVLADLGRVIRWRRQWLASTVLAIDRAEGDTLQVPLPAELSVEAAANIIETKVVVTRAMRNELALELEILGAPGTTVADQLPGGAREKAIAMIRADYILDAL